VLIAAQRARDMVAGAQPTLDRDNDKNPVVALREIAAESVPFDGLRNALIKGMQKQVEIDEPEEDQDIEIGAQSAWPVDLGPAMEIDEDGVDEEVEDEEEPPLDDELPEDMLLADEEAAELGDDALPEGGDEGPTPGAPKG